MSGKVSVGIGFSPRVFPRPKYISLFDTLIQMLRSIVFQSGVIGTILTILSYPLYIKWMMWMKNILGEYGNDAILITILLSISHTATYVLVNGLFGIFDYFQYFQEYKLVRKSYMNPKKDLIIKCLLEAALGQFILSPLGTYYLLYPGFTKHGMTDVFSALPTNFELFRGYCVANLFNGVMFYFAHRLFHSKLLYPIFHKQHHEFNGTMGIAAEYANPIEQIFANMIPSLLGMILFPTHPLCVAIWLVSSNLLFISFHFIYLFFHFFVN